MTQLKEKLSIQYDKYFEKAERYKNIMRQLKTQLDAHKKAAGDLTKAYKWHQDQYDNIKETSSQKLEEFELRNERNTEERLELQNDLTITKNRLERTDEKLLKQMEEFKRDRARYENQILELEQDVDRLNNDISELNVQQQRAQRDSEDQTETQQQ